MILHINPRSDRIEDQAGKEQEDQSSDELHDATLGLFRVFPPAGERILDSGKDDHEHADEAGEVRGVLDERSESPDDGIETGAYGAFVEPGSLGASASERLTIRPGDFFSNVDEGSSAFLFTGSGSGSNRRSSARGGSCRRSRRCGSSAGRGSSFPGGSARFGGRYHGAGGIQSRGIRDSCADLVSNVVSGFPLGRRSVRNAVGRFLFRGNHSGRGIVVSVRSVLRRESGWHRSRDEKREDEGSGQSFHITFGNPRDP